MQLKLTELVAIKCPLSGAQHILLDSIKLKKQLRLLLLKPIKLFDLGVDFRLVMYERDLSTRVDFGDPMAGPITGKTDVLREAFPFIWSFYSL